LRSLSLSAASSSGGASPVKQYLVALANRWTSDSALLPFQRLNWCHIGVHGYLSLLLLLLIGAVNAGPVVINPKISEAVS
jgi:hypothetical protein